MVTKASVKGFSIISLITVIFTLTACLNREASFTLVVRNQSESEIALKKVTVNDLDYNNQSMALAPVTAPAVNSGEYWAGFTSGKHVKIRVVIHDAAQDREYTFVETLVDQAGEGYAILMEYTGSGKLDTSTSTVGRLSAWGSK